MLVHCATANDIVSKNDGAGVSLSVNGTINILNAAVRASISKVIYFSTAQVYGTELVGRINEKPPNFKAHMD